MNSPLGLSRMDALKKAQKIIKRDSGYLKSNNIELKLQNELEGLVINFMMCDPDVVFNKISSYERNQTILKDEINFMITMNLKQIMIKIYPERQLHFFDLIRYNSLLEKYKLLSYAGIEMSIASCPIMMAFPEIEFNLKKENSSLSPPLPDCLKAYKNFKKEYLVTMLSVLPSGKKYGGYVKALIHYAEADAPSVTVMDVRFNMQTMLIGTLRMLYNSKLYSNEERVEKFEKTGIKESDCALWTEVFDRQYPHFKNIHKIFGQLA